MPGPKVKGTVYKVQLLDGTFHDVALEKGGKGASLFDKVCGFVNLLEKDYFGLSFRDVQGQKHWIDSEKKVGKQLGKLPKELYIEVKFYPPEPSQLQEDITRYQLCLQVRRDIIEGKLPCSSITHALLSSYFVQSELGDFEEEEHGESSEYVRDFILAPQVTQELLDKTAELHGQHTGQSPAESEFHFLEIGKKLSMYGIHLHEAVDSEGVSLQIGISADGVHVYRDTLRINRFSWPKILNVKYKRKLFYLKQRPGKFEKYESTIGFKTPSHRHAKRLWKIAIEHHTFFRRKEAQPEKSTMSILPRFGSRFRYSGRTQHQTRQLAASIDRPPPLFERTASRRTASTRITNHPARHLPARDPPPPAHDDRLDDFEEPEPYIPTERSHYDIPDTGDAGTRPAHSQGGDNHYSEPPLEGDRDDSFDDVEDDEDEVHAPAPPSDPPTPIQEDDDEEEEAEPEPEPVRRAPVTVDL